MQRREGLMIRNGGTGTLVQVELFSCIWHIKLLILCRMDDVKVVIYGG